MLKRRFTKSIRSSKSLEEAIVLINNELNTIGFANVSSRGRITVSKFIKEGFIPPLFSEIEGNIKQTGENISIELIVKSKFPWLIVIAFLITVIGIPFIPFIILFIYIMPHGAACRIASKSLKNIEYDLG